MRIAWKELLEGCSNDEGRTNAVFSVLNDSRPARISARGGPERQFAKCGGRAGPPGFELGGDTHHVAGFDDMTPSAPSDLFRQESIAQQLVKSNRKSFRICGRHQQAGAWRYQFG